MIDLLQSILVLIIVIVMIAGVLYYDELGIWWKRIWKKFLKH